MERFHLFFVTAIILSCGVALGAFAAISGAGTETWGTVTDWMQTMIAGLVAYGGFIGLETWKRQLQGTDRYETAKRVLRSFLGVRRKIEEAYFPGFREEENALVSKVESILPAAREKGEGLNQFRVLLAVSMRTKAVADEVQNLRTEALMGRVVLGSDLGDELEAVDRLVELHKSALLEYMDEVVHLPKRTAQAMMAIVKGDELTSDGIPSLPGVPEVVRMELESATDSVMAAVAEFGIKKS